MNPLTPTSSLKELAQHYRSVKGASWTPMSIGTFDHQLRAIFAHWDPNRPINGFTIMDAASLIKYCLEGRKNNGNTVRRRVRYVHDIFQSAVNAKVLEENPVEFRRLPKIAKSVVTRVPFLPGEFDRLIASLNYLTAIDEEMWTCACQVGYHTGLRISDVADLRWEPEDPDRGNYVDFERECIVAHPQKTWARRKRVEIPMEPELFELLTRLYGERDPATPWVNPLFRWNQLRCRSYVVNRFRFICDRIGLKRHSFHSFRHGFVSRLVNAGVEIPIVRSMTGQCESSIRLYIHVTHEARVMALAQARNALHQVKLQSFRNNV